MSVVVTSLLVAGGVLVGRWIMRTGGSGGASPPKPPEEAGGDPTKPEDVKAAEQDPFANFPCRLGDVVLRMGGGEAWLSGALIFAEDVPVAILFIAPEAGEGLGLLVRPNPSTTFIWLEPLPKGSVVTGNEPPTCVEHEGQRYDRVRRLPVHVRRVGSGAPDVGDRAILAEYIRGDGEQLLVVVGAGPARAWLGRALEIGMYDILPGGAGTT